MSYRHSFMLVIGLLLCGAGVSALAQETTSEEEIQLPEIPDTPRTVDPTRLLSPELAAEVSVDLSDSSLRELINWLQESRGLVVLLDNNAVASVGVSPAEPVADRLDGQPLYLLLNRLSALDLTWYFDDEILHITSVEAAEQRTATVTFNVGDLLDAGYEMDNILETIENTVHPEYWSAVGGDGELSALGDVLFVRQTDEVKRQVQGLLEALRSHGRQTYVNDPEQHLHIREQLQENISVDFSDTPLETAIRDIAAMAGIDIRLDIQALRRVRIREREPVTLSLQDRKLQTVLQAIVLDLDLTWLMRDGVLWITTKDEAETLHKLAVYDVRDLCRDPSETAALLDALERQTDPDSWESVGGPGTMSPAKPGTIVILQEERVQAKVLGLLETYREALRASKFRQREEEDPNRIETVYYRTYTLVAEELLELLPQLVSGESWQSDANPDAKGQIRLVASAPALTDSNGIALVDSQGQVAIPALLVERSVLIVQQTPAVHDEIRRVITRIESGDPRVKGGGGFGGGGFGGGGFGGGFFSIPSGKR